MTEVAGLVAALAAVGALYFAYRTVTEARDAHAEDERDRKLNRIERLAVALTQLATELEAGSIALARITQARARVLWVAAGTAFGEHVRAAVNDEISAASSSGVAAVAREGVDDLLTGLADFLAARR